MFFATFAVKLNDPLPATLVLGQPVKPVGASRFPFTVLPFDYVTVYFAFVLMLAKIV